jgi:drug/metabolite transporter (DMT)-like permease
MPASLLYALVVLIWGSTWSAISYQLGPVAVEVSVAYRFAIASVALFAFARLSGRPLRLARGHYSMVAWQGAILFSANYFFVYYASSYVTTGLIAVLFSLIVLSNAFFERLFFKTAFEGRLLLAALFGVAGVALMFWPEVSELSLRDDTIVGFAWALLGVLTASLGNMAAVVNTRRSQPVITVNAYAMACGAICSALVAALLGHPFNFSFETSYVISLLYLAILGSSVAFGAYLTLIRRIGSARAAYASVLFPVVALTLSTVFEGYQWSVLAVAGIVLTMVGNWLALTRYQHVIAPLDPASTNGKETRNE